MIDMVKNVLQSLLLQHSKSKIYLKMLTGQLFNESALTTLIIL